MSHVLERDHCICKNQMQDPETNQVEVFCHLSRPQNSVLKNIHRITDKVYSRRNPPPTGNELNLLLTMWSKLLQWFYKDQMSRTVTGQKTQTEAPPTENYKRHSRMASPSSQSICRLLGLTFMHTHISSRG